MLKDVTKTVSPLARGGKVPAALTSAAFTAAALLVLFSLDRASAPARAQEKERELTVSADFSAERAVAPTERIRLRLSRPLLSAEGAPAVFIGRTDVTSLFTQAAEELVYSSQSPPLPVGDTSVTVYIVSPGGEWKEIAKLPLRVEEKRTDAAPTGAGAPRANGKRTRLGFDQAEFKPALTVNIRSQSALLYFPDSDRPDRVNFTDLSFQGSLVSNLTRGLFSSQSQFDLVGFSFQREALRFGERAEAAPQVDLSNYFVQFQAGKVKVLLGHNSYGSNRYLISGFSSRGLTVTLPVNKRADFSFSAMNGTSVVGWNNFSGLQRRKHKVVSGTLGYEFLPERPGGLRLEMGLLRGSLLPISNFNQSTLTDAETSRGFGARLVASDKEGRFRLDAGYARSRFGNPADPLLNQGFEVVPVREAGRGAYYADLSYQILRDLAVTRDRKANLTFSFRHNRVDPLFRSVAVFAQADRLDNQFELAGGVGDINAGVSYNRLDDNLDDIPSILKTLTRRNAFQVGGPLVSFFGGAASPSNWWLPRVSYGFDRTHQFGAFIPLNSDFTSPSQIPDQASRNQSFNAEWQRERLRFGYRLNHVFQDNRQTGRERADFRSLVNSFTVGVQPHQRLDVSFDLSFEGANNLEAGRLDRTRRAGLSFNWQTTKQSTLAATASTVFAGDAARVSRSRNADLDLQWSLRFGVGKSQYRKVQGQFLVRYANRYARATDNLFLFRNITKIQTANAGLSFTFF
jgi:hypothetical protein